MAPPTPCWLAMRIITTEGGAPVASASGTHRGRLKLFHTRLPRVRYTSWPSAYTATVPMVCQRGKYRCVVRSPPVTGQRYHLTSGGAATVLLSAARLRCRWWGSATSRQSASFANPSGTVAGASQPAPGSMRQRAWSRCRAPAPAFTGPARQYPRASPPQKQPQAHAPGTHAGRAPGAADAPPSNPRWCATAMASARVLTCSLA